MNVIFLSLSITFLIGLFFLTGLASSLRRIHKKDSKKNFREMGYLYFYRPFHLFFFPEDEYESLLFASLSAQNVCRFLFVFFAILFAWEENLPMLDGSILTLITLSTLILFYGVGDYVPRILGSRFPVKTLWLSAPIASPFLYLSFPLTFLFIKIPQLFWKNIYFDQLNEPLLEAKQEILDIIQEAEFTSVLNIHDKKLFESVVNFQNRIAREIMVPRVDIFSLNAETSIKDAARLLQEEGYSRVPVYKGTIDQIVGVLMYKEILSKYMEFAREGDLSTLEAPIETIVKNVIYTPETKKISNLLQEFRKKQQHLAIVVDEYGGTEGIVTIEDILEEIVGEIEDEYDEEEELFTALSDGTWIVDARMTIIDAEEQFGIEIPQEGDYDTIGGYIFHQAGSIPGKGFSIKLDTCQIDVLKSNDRRVEKVKIKLVNPNKNQETLSNKA
ncbi:MAG: hemolysin family protein [Parachlamydiaceae bacterium]